MSIQQEVNAQYPSSVGSSSDRIWKEDIIHTSGELHDPNAVTYNVRRELVDGKEGWVHTGLNPEVLEFCKYHVFNKL